MGHNAQPAKWQRHPAKPKRYRRVRRKTQGSPGPSPFRSRRSVAPQSFTAEGRGSSLAPTGRRSFDAFLLNWLEDVNRVVVDGACSVSLTESHGVSRGAKKHT